MLMMLHPDRPFQTMLDELKRLKDEYPDRILIASIMEEYNRWAQLIQDYDEY
jgi:dihydropyrimidine dehydrogenase (NADP+)